MRGKPVTKKEIKKIKKLRETGHSLPEICRVLKRRNSTVHRFAKNIVVLPEYINILRQKQGGSIRRSEEFWKKANDKADFLLKRIDKRDRLFILAALYWGEGAKRELNIINSDPELIKVFILCLREIGVKEKDLRISLRIYDDIDATDAKKYWAKVCGINTKNILNVNVLIGKKSGKLPFGMCRVRVTKSAESFKLIMSMIKFIKSQIIKLS
jgi:hypothetical protein